MSARAIWFTLESKASAKSKELSTKENYVHSGMIFIESDKLPVSSVVDGEAR